MIDGHSFLSSTTSGRLTNCSPCFGTRQICDTPLEQAVRLMLAQGTTRSIVHHQVGGIVFDAEIMHLLNG